MQTQDTWLPKVPHAVNEMTARVRTLRAADWPTLKIARHLGMSRAVIHHLHYLATKRHRAARREAQQ